MDPTIFIVDDDPAVCRALAGIGPVLARPVEMYASAADFLKVYEPQRPGCLVLDVRMPEMTGLELQQLLVERKVGIPIVMISGHASVRIAVEAMTKGAVTLLEKP